MFTWAKKILSVFKAEGMDEAHETLKGINYKGEKGYVKKNKNHYVWVTEKKETFQIPKNEKR